MNWFFPVSARGFSSHFPGLSSVPCLRFFKIEVIKRGKIRVKTVLKRPVLLLAAFLGEAAVHVLNISFVGNIGCLEPH